MTFLWEIIEDYKAAETQEEKDKIFADFCKAIWDGSGGWRRFYKKISYTVPTDLLHTDIGQVFQKYEIIRYPTTEKRTEHTAWNYIIRQYLNNLYVKNFDKTICDTQKYGSMLNYPKTLFYKWKKDPENFPYTAETLQEAIIQKLIEAEDHRARVVRRKKDLSLLDYRDLCNGFFRKCFDNCKLLEDYDSYEEELYETSSEDHFYTGYFCKSISGYLSNYMIESYGVKRQRKTYTLTYCSICGTPFYQKPKTKKRVMCDECKKKADKIYKKNYYLRHKDEIARQRRKSRKQKNILIQKKDIESIVVKKDD